MKIHSSYFKKQYELSKGQLIGEGNFAQVYRIYDQHLKQSLAIRKVKKSQSDMEDIKKEKIINEELRKVENQNILKIYDIIDTEDAVWYITEYCSGGSLWDVLNYCKDNKMNEKDCLEVVLQISIGVQQLHNHRITHRDLKPENILLKSKYTPNKPLPVIKLADFGLSTKKIIMQTIAGTKQYIAPQQAKFHNYTNAVDVWSLGIICDEILHGNPYYSGENNKEVFDKILKMPFKVRDQSIRQSIKHFLVSLLKKKPYERPIIAVIRKSIEKILQEIEQQKKSLKNSVRSLKTKEKNPLTQSTKLLEKQTEHIPSNPTTAFKEPQSNQKKQEFQEKQSVVQTQISNQGNINKNNEDNNSVQKKHIYNPPSAARVNPVMNNGNATATKNDPTTRKKSDHVAANTTEKLEIQAKAEQLISAKSVQPIVSASSSSARRKQTTLQNKNLNVKKQIGIQVFKQHKQYPPPKAAETQRSQKSGKIKPLHAVNRARLIDKKADERNQADLQNKNDNSGSKSNVPKTPLNSRNERKKVAVPSKRDQIKAETMDVRVFIDRIMANKKQLYEKYGGFKAEKSPSFLLNTFINSNQLTVSTEQVEDEMSNYQSEYEFLGSIAYNDDYDAKLYKKEKQLSKDNAQAQQGMKKIKQQLRNQFLSQIDTFVDTFIDKNIS